ncbi:NAD(+) synthetase [bacterium]|nr:MAG: NAD(+) synthetase [bacterium]
MACRRGFPLLRKRYVTMSALSFDAERETKKIEEFISDFVRGRNVSGIVHGLSGGVDSAVVALLVQRALGTDRQFVLLLPERDSSESGVTDAKAMCERFGIEYKLLNITQPLEHLGTYSSAPSKLAKFGGGMRFAVKAFPFLSKKGYISNLKGSDSRQFREFIAFYRIKHRMRMVVIYHEAEKRGMAVASCANRTEFEVGFFVKYGDDSGDIAPIKHLYKTQVFALARYLGVPREIIEKKPSPDLFAQVADEEIMGVGYETVDSILALMAEGLGEDEIAERLSIKSSEVRFVSEMKIESEELRTPPASLLG